MPAENSHSFSIIQQALTFLAVNMFTLFIALKDRCRHISRVKNLNYDNETTMKRNALAALIAVAVFGAASFGANADQIVELQNQLSSKSAQISDYLNILNRTRSDDSSYADYQHALTQSQRDYADIERAITVAQRGQQPAIVMPASNPSVDSLRANIAQQKAISEEHAGKATLLQSQYNVQASKVSPNVLLHYPQAMALKEQAAQERALAAAAAGSVERDTQALKAIEAAQAVKPVIAPALPPSHTPYITPPDVVPPVSPTLAPPKPLVVPPVGKEIAPPVPVDNGALAVKAATDAAGVSLVSGTAVTAPATSSVTQPPVISSGIKKSTVLPAVRKTDSSVAVFRTVVVQNAQAQAQIDANTQAVRDVNARQLRQAQRVEAQSVHIETLESTTNSRFASIDKKVDAVKRHADAGIAGVAAMANIPMIADKAVTVGAGVGARGDAQALSVGAKFRVSESVAASVGVAADTEDGYTLGAGVGFGF
ncbi:TPA: YadA C-terminal domain-containing protein [Enterobacter hormaechei subsp. steigerwaltii]|nr:YadA C-terminal domain-containing protein [Enterobacter hormaechei subsp. steigerwaltii]